MPKKSQNNKKLGNCTKCTYGPICKILYRDCREILRFDVSLEIMAVAAGGTLYFSHFIWQDSTSFLSMVILGIVVSGLIALIVTSVFTVRLVLAKSSEEIFEFLPLFHSILLFAIGFVFLVLAFLKTIEPIILSTSYVLFRFFFAISTRFPFLVPESDVIDLVQLVTLTIVVLYLYSLVLLASYVGERISIKIKIELTEKIQIYCGRGKHA